MIDQLTYPHSDAARPDRLTQMADTGIATKGFVYTIAGAAYQYGGNGNATQDNYKGFTCHSLNLSEPIPFADHQEFMMIHGWHIPYLYPKSNHSP